MQTAAALIEREEERGTERMDELLERGKANGDTLTCSELVEALEQQMMTPTRWTCCISASSTGTWRL